MCIKALKFLPVRAILSLPLRNRAGQTELEWIPIKAMPEDSTRRCRYASEFADDVGDYLNGSPTQWSLVRTIY